MKLRLAKQKGIRGGHAPTGVAGFLSREMATHDERLPGSRPAMGGRRNRSIRSGRRVLDDQRALPETAYRRAAVQAEIIWVWAEADGSLRVRRNEKLPGRLVEEAKPTV